MVVTVMVSSAWAPHTRASLFPVGFLFGEMFAQYLSLSMCV